MIAALLATLPFTVQDLGWTCVALALLVGIASVAPPAAAAVVRRRTRADAGSPRVPGAHDGA